MQDHERHTIAVIVDNEPGVLARVIGLFSGRGYNIESLTVAVVDTEQARRHAAEIRGRHGIGIGQFRSSRAGPGRCRKNFSVRIQICRPHPPPRAVPSASA